MQYVKNHKHTSNNIMRYEVTPYGDDPNYHYVKSDVWWSPTQNKS